MDCVRSPRTVASTLALLYAPPSFKNLAGSPLPLVSLVYMQENWTAACTFLKVEKYITKTHHVDSKWQIFEGSRGHDIPFGHHVRSPCPNYLQLVRTFQLVQTRTCPSP